MDGSGKAPAREGEPILLFVSCKQLSWLFVAKSPRFPDYRKTIWLASANCLTANFPSFCFTSKMTISDPEIWIFNRLRHSGRELELIRKTFCFVAYLTNFERQRCFKWTRWSERRNPVHRQHEFGHQLQLFISFPQVFHSTTLEENSSCDLNSIFRQMRKHSEIYTFLKIQ